MTSHNIHGSYDASLPLGYRGMIATANQRDAYSYKIESSAAGFGLAMGQGSADRGAVLGGSDFVGITIADKSLIDETYAVGATASLLRQGVIWVTAATEVSPGDAVTYASDGTLGAGLANTISGARFDGTASPGALVRISLR